MIDFAENICKNGRRERENWRGKTGKLFAATGKFGTSSTARIAAAPPRRNQHGAL